MSMANSEDIPTEPPIAGTEVETLIGSLERQRATLAWKCGGLDARGLRVRVGVSRITLGGLLKHLARCERAKFLGMLQGRPLGAPWSEVDWDAEPEWEWTSALDDTPEELMALWRRSVATHGWLWPRHLPTAAWTIPRPTPRRRGNHPVSVGC
jgi:hypothetical protein